MTPLEEKQNRIIQAKIVIKENRINDISQIFPATIGIIGFLIALFTLSFALLLFWLVGVIIGILLIILAVWWYIKNDAAKTKLRNEIDELEAEFDDEEDEEDEEDE